MGKNLEGREQDRALDDPTKSTQLPLTPEGEALLGEKSRESQEIKNNTTEKLRALKKSIEKPSISDIREIIESIGSMDVKNKPFMIGSLISLLSKNGLSLDSFKGGVLRFKEGRQNQTQVVSDNLPVYTKGEAKLIGNLFETGTGKYFTKEDLMKGLLYRNYESIDKYAQSSNTEVSTTDYVMYLLDKYGIEYTRGGINGIGKKEELLKINQEDENTYLDFKKYLGSKITENIGERDFLVGYFDDLYYNSGTSVNDSYIGEFKSAGGENYTKLIGELNNLSNEEKYILGIKREDDFRSQADKLRYDPIGAIKDSLQNGGGSLGILLGILGMLFWRKKKGGIWAGFMGGFARGVGIGAGGIGFALEEGIKGGFFDQEKKENTLSSKIRLVAPEGLDQDKLDNYWLELSKNPKFLGAKATEIFSIFGENNNPGSDKDELKKYGIDLTVENDAYYQYIFKEIYRQRKDLIGEPKPDETIGEYLERKQKTKDETKAGGAVAATSEGTEVPSEPKSNTDSHLGESNEGKEEHEPIPLGYIIDGKNYIIGDNGEPELFTYENLDPEFNQKIDLLKNQSTKVGNFVLILQTLTSNDSKKYTPILEEFNRLIKATDVTQDDSIKKLDDWIGVKNLEITKGINLNNKARVYEFIRNIDYNIAEKHLAIELFSDITKLTDDDIQAMSDNPTGNHTKIKEILGDEGYAELQKDISQKKADAEKYFINNQKDLKERLKNDLISGFKRENPNITDEQIDERLSNMDLDTMLSNDTKQNIIGSFVDIYAKNMILESYISRQLSEKNVGGGFIKDWRGGYDGPDELIKMYSNIRGIGWGVVSDKSLSWGKEAFSIIAWEAVAIAAGAVTMGAGAVAINAMVWGTRGVKIAKYAYKVSEAANSGSKIARASRWAGTTIAEGSSFYVGYGGAQSAIEGRNMYSTKGFAESIAFVGAFKGVSVVGSKLNLNWSAGSTLVGKSARLATGLTLEAGTLAGVGLAIDGVIFEPGEWSAEMILQAFAMAILMRGAGKLSSDTALRFKNDGGRVSVSETRGSPRYIKAEDLQSTKFTDAQRLELKNNGRVSREGFYNGEKVEIVLNQNKTTGKITVRSIKKGGEIINPKDIDFTKLSIYNIESAGKAFRRGDIVNAYNNLQPGESINVVGMKFSKRPDGRLDYIKPNGEAGILNEGAFMKVMRDLEGELLLNAKLDIMPKSALNKPKKIDGHEVTIDSNGNYIIQKETSKGHLETLTKDEDIARFLNNNVDRLIKEFSQKTTSQIGESLKMKTINSIGSSKNTFNQFINWLDEAGARNGHISKLWSWDGLIGAGVRPLQFVAQFIKSSQEHGIISRGFFDDAARNIFLGNKYAKYNPKGLVPFSGHFREGLNPLNPGLGRGLLTGAIVLGGGYKSGAELSGLGIPYTILANFNKDDISKIVTEAGRGVSKTAGAVKDGIGALGEKKQVKD